jgi:hypothetical protein
MRTAAVSADRAFAAAVPAELMTALTAHQDRLAPELRGLWQASGSRKSGTWADVFGGGPAGQEVFMAWHFGRYTDAVTAAGKKAYRCRYS